jgi:Winged helix DNA-binding domain
MNVYQCQRSRFVWRRGPGYRTPCRGLRCYQSMRGSRSAIRIVRSILLSSNSGGPRFNNYVVDARLELTRRYLHVFDPSTVASFTRWAGIGKKEASNAFAELIGTLVPVNTPAGDAWILADDEAAFRQPFSPKAAAAARLLPSGDSYYLLWDADREILVTDAKRRTEFWTTRVWPGAVLVNGEIVGIWRRSAGEVSIDTGRRLSPAEWEAIEAEAVALPLPGLNGRITIHRG